MADSGPERGVPIGVSPYQEDGEQPALFHCRKQDCTWSSASESNLNQHMQGHDRPFICEICHNAWKRNDELLTHKWKYHGVNTPWVCHYEGCKRKGQGLRSQSLLERHLDDHGITSRQNDKIHSDRVLDGFATLHRQMTELKQDNNRDEFESLRPKYMGKVAELSGLVMNLTR
ncbi:hypothetical protein PG996_014979 [Apiospora saccharicola]|uniref:C2H2-type domain-containing protein n=1 Tax=Apiospora saccharicola TaxID=335842 RepID=A0ABR1TJU3_9PEZI